MAAQLMAGQEKVRLSWSWSLSCTNGVLGKCVFLGLEMVLRPKSPFVLLLGTVVHQNGLLGKCLFLGLEVVLPQKSPFVPSPGGRDDRDESGRSLDMISLHKVIGFI